MLQHPGVARWRAELFVSGVEVPALLILAPGPASPRRAHPVGVIDPPVESRHFFGVVELGPGLFEFTFVDQEGRIERRVLLHVLDEVRVEPGQLVQGLVTLLERFSPQWLVG